MFHAAVDEFAGTVVVDTAVGAFNRQAVVDAVGTHFGHELTAFVNLQAVRSFLVVVGQIERIVDVGGRTVVVLIAQAYHTAGLVAVDVIGHLATRRDAVGAEALRPPLVDAVGIVEVLFVLFEATADDIPLDLPRFGRAANRRFETFYRNLQRIVGYRCQFQAVDVMATGKVGYGYVNRAGRIHHHPLLLQVLQRDALALRFNAVFVVGILQTRGRIAAAHHAQQYRIAHARYGVGGRQRKVKVRSNAYGRIYRLLATAQGVEQVERIDDGIGGGTLYGGCKADGVGQIGGRRPYRAVVELIGFAQVVNRRVAVADLERFGLSRVKTVEEDAVFDLATVEVGARQVEPVRNIGGQRVDDDRIAVCATARQTRHRRPGVAVHTLCREYRAALLADTQRIHIGMPYKRMVAAVNADGVDIVATLTGVNREDNRIVAGRRVVNGAVELVDETGGPAAVGGLPAVGKVADERGLADAEHRGVAGADIEAVGAYVHLDFTIDIDLNTAEVDTATAGIGYPGAVGDGARRRDLERVVVNRQGLALEVHQRIDTQERAFEAVIHYRRIPIAIHDERRARRANRYPEFLRPGGRYGIVFKDTVFDVKRIVFFGHEEFPLVFRTYTGAQYDGVAVANRRVGRNELLAARVVGQFYLVVIVLLGHKAERVFGLRLFVGMGRADAVVRRGNDAVEFIARTQIRKRRRFTDVERAVEYGILDERAVEHPAVTRGGAAVGRVRRKGLLRGAVFDIDIGYPRAYAVHGGLYIHRPRIHALRGGIEQLVVAEVTHHAVGHLDHKLVVGKVTAERAYVLAAFVDSEVIDVEVNRVIERGIIVVVAVAAYTRVRREADHTVIAHIARRKADRTVVLDLLFGNNAAIGPATAATVFVNLTVAEVEAVAVGLPYHGFFDNLGADIVGRIQRHFHFRQRTDDKDRVFVEYRRRRGARSRGRHLETYGQRVGLFGRRGIGGIFKRGARTFERAVDVPFKFGRITATLDVDGLHRDDLFLADRVAARTEIDVS